MPKVGLAEARCNVFHAPGGRIQQAGELFFVGSAARARLLAVIFRQELAGVTGNLLLKVLNTFICEFKLVSKQQCRHKEKLRFGRRLHLFLNLGDALIDLLGELGQMLLFTIVAGQYVVLIVNGDGDLCHGGIRLMGENGTNFANRTFETTRHFISEAFEFNFFDVEPCELVREAGSIFFEGVEFAHDFFVEWRKGVSIAALGRNFEPLKSGIEPCDGRINLFHTESVYANLGLAESLNSKPPEQSLWSGQTNHTHGCGSGALASSDIKAFACAVMRRSISMSVRVTVMKIPSLRDGARMT